MGRRKKNSLPELRCHKGRARFRFKGREYYCGAFGSPEAYAERDRIIGGSSPIRSRSSPWSASPPLLAAARVRPVSQLLWGEEGVRPRTGITPVTRLPKKLPEPGFADGSSLMRHESVSAVALLRDALQNWFSRALADRDRMNLGLPLLVQPSNDGESRLRGECTVGE